MDRKSIKISVLTLGCKLNYSESSLFARQLRESGYGVVTTLQSADLYIINTCSVTEHADKKCRNLISKIHRRSPDSPIIVTGCYAQLKSDLIKTIEGVSMVIGAESKSNLLAIVSDFIEKYNKQNEVKAIYCCDIESVKTFFPAYSSTDRTRSFLKIQDGCNYRCTYCTVPLARGGSRSDTITSVVNNATQIAARGIKEIVLTGVNTGDFGVNNGESFEELLKELNMIDGIERYRISSIEPNLLSDGIIEWIASGTKFLPHFHIPLQSGSDTVLRLMGRRYTSSQFEEKIMLLKERIPFVYIGIDVIVGFPGETDELFEETYSLLKRVEPSFLHIFPYSQRDNTPAATMQNQVSEIKKRERAKLLAQLSDTMYNRFIESNKSREEEVLIESRDKEGKMYGYTRNYIKVEMEYNSKQMGEIIKVKM